MKPTTRDWLEIATEDLDTAQAMCAGGRYLYAGFAAQESAEKALRAVIQEGARVPPKIHDLETLAERAGLDDAAPGGRFRILSLYYRGARHPAERAPRARTRPWRWR